MNRHAEYATKLYRQSAEFLRAAELSSPFGDVEPHAERLAAIARRLEELAIEQETHKRTRREATANVKRLIRSLRLTHIRSVVRAARAFLPKGDPARAALRVPRNLRRNADVVALALTVAEVVGQVGERLSRFASAAEIAHALRTAADAASLAIGRQDYETARVSATTAAIFAEVRQGRFELATLDALITGPLEQSPELAATWRSFRQQGRVPTQVARRRS